MLRAVLTISDHPTVGGFLMVKLLTTIGIVLIARLVPKLELIGCGGMLIVGAFWVAPNAGILLSS